ncbi:hypothetical protein BT63DRAFT_478970 [Microthyrium microscopicum]|uniref:Uncharacterized protein n=1 Tax=Microthyrium microscopicum TaxID=703497 RepID=A0A6A6UBW0_9PEZI|nr:hypothetical protein BT63DRAFT_478970 [Microthyrium microscopicum]
MMQLKLNPVLLPSLFSLLTIPASALAKNLESPRPQIGAFLFKTCVDRDLQGQCLSNYYPWGCQNIEPDLNDRVSSIQAYNEGIKWTLWVDADCAGGSVTYIGSGVGNLEDVGMNDRMSSLQWDLA